MKVILNYDQATGQITDSTGMIICTWVNLNYDPEPSEKGGSMLDGEQLIRIMKIAANVEAPENVKDL